MVNMFFYLKLQLLSSYRLIVLYIVNSTNLKDMRKLEISHMRTLFDLKSFLKTSGPNNNRIKKWRGFRSNWDVPIIKLFRMFGSKSFCARILIILCFPSFITLLAANCCSQRALHRRHARHSWCWLQLLPTSPAGRTFGDI